MSGAYPRRGADAPAGAQRSEAGVTHGLTGRLVLASALLTLVVGAAFAVLLVAVADLRDASRAARHSEEVLPL